MKRSKLPPGTLCLLRWSQPSIVVRVVEPTSCGRYVVIRFSPLTKVEDGIREGVERDYLLPLEEDEAAVWRLTGALPERLKVPT